MYNPVQLLRNLTAGHSNAFRHLLHPFKYRQRNDAVVSVAASATTATDVSASSYHRSASLLSNDTTDRNWAPVQAIQPKFRFKRALIVTKLSRFEFEQHIHPKMTIIELEHLLRNRGTDYDAMMEIHKAHKEFEARVADSFKQFGIEVILSNRVTLSTKQTNWADIVVPIGGDGTFLLTASRACPLLANDKPIVGFNSDPVRSEGRLLLPKQYSYETNEAVRKLMQGEFSWLKRSRIRITMLGQNGHLPVSLDLQEMEPTPMELNEYPTEILNDSDKELYRAKVKRILPYLALNEVFIGENLSARVSHLQLTIDKQKQVNKTKSSGLCVSTGTGSSSWLTSINRLSTQNVQTLLNLINGGIPENSVNAAQIADRYNEELLFPPDDLRLCYSIREQICVGVWPKPKGFASMGFATNLQIKSRCIDAGLVIDGSISYPFNDGAKVLLEVHPEDALLTVNLDET